MTLSFNEALKLYWPIGISIITIGVSFTAQWAVLGIRITALEDRQNRQATNLSALQTQVIGLANDVSGMKADIGSIKDNVTYIRSRIDAITR